MRYIFYLAFILLSCTSGDIIVQSKLIKIDFASIVNSTEYENLNLKLDKLLETNITESGFFKYKKSDLYKTNLSSKDFSKTQANFIVAGEITSFEKGITTRYQIPLFFYAPGYYCKIKFSVFIYDVSKKKLYKIHQFEVNKIKSLGFRFFSIDKNDPDFILNSSEKNELITEAAHELSEKVVEYLSIEIK